MTWECIHFDFVGPIFEHMFFVKVNSHSEWLEVYPMEMTTTIKQLNVYETVL